MSVESADVLLKLSTKSGTAGDSTGSTPNDSLGKYVAQTEVDSGSLHNLFDEISGIENASQNVDYRCIFVHNSNATDTFLNVRVFILSEVAGGADVEIGIDPTVASAADSASAQAVEIADEDTAPSGVAFSAPTTLSEGLSVGDLAGNEVRAVWVKRTATDSDPVSSDGATLRVQGETL